MASSSKDAGSSPPLSQPLNKDKREIRLLEILPNTPDGKVNCKLHTVLLTRDLHYTCLSYVWGDPSVTDEIIVDGVSRQVTVTLATALRHVKKHWIDIERKSDAELDTSKFRLWADALCINQSDLAERLHQVSMMADIYSLAAMVLAWLSSSDKVVSEGFDVFDKINQMRQGISLPEELFPEFAGIQFAHIIGGPIHWGAERFSWLFPPYCSLFNTEDVDTLHPAEPFVAVFNFCQLPFWSRAWIHQEVILAKRLYLLSPSHRKEHLGCIAALSELYIYLQTTNETTEDPGRRFKARIYKYVFQRPYELFCTRESFQGSIGDLPRSEMWRLAIHLCTNANATDNRDYIYGLLSVAKSSIVPDYTKDFRQVSLDFMAWVLPLWKEIHETAVKRNWEVVYGDKWRYDISNIFNSHAVGVKRLYGLPSWAPVFSEADRRTPIVREPTERRSANGTVPELVNRLPIKILDDGLTLRIEGIKAQSVDYVYDEIVSPELLETRLTKCIITLKSRLGEAYRNGKSVLEIICCTLLGKEACDDYMHQVCIWLRHSGQCNLLSMDGLERLLLHNYDLGSILCGWRNAKRSQNGNRLFTTKDGYIGTMPDDVRLGDVVCVLTGFSELAVLRPEGDHYLFVGCCFMIGLMSGEVSKLLEKGEVAIEAIDIR
ncbi:heterokaryon incompatibility het-6 [Fusarium tjaetaba]|uniref:Heterokaryon incompatibility het-6 n=1 Tax=Fusarium tjaetaba TaxID=1567544 RepID=A0A8H5QXR8_9HYPO|nr:heterokaryon incompatibility het-6 [Fusarium tjaetaba]KAF5622768.1 heterokaryon incompatibility het-6 [Fusarium tjaetaba]